MRHVTIETQAILTIVVLLAAARFTSAKEPPATPLPEVAELPAQSSLPDPLLMLNGERVSNKEQWIK